MSDSVTVEYVDLLSHNPLFSGLDRLTLAKLAAHVEPVHVPVGETLFRQGDPADGLYLINRGRLGVYGRAASGSDEVRLGTCDPGDAVGEIALLTGAGRTATVTAEADSELLRVDRGRFSDLVRANPSVGRAVSNKLIGHLQAAEGVILRRSTSQLTDADESTSPRARTHAPPQVAEPTSLTRASRRASRSKIGLGLAALFLVGGWTIPPPVALGLTGWHALAGVLAVVPLFATSAIPDAAIGLALVSIWVLGGVVSAPVALGGFATATWVLVVSVSAIGSAIASTGLLYRAALWLAAHSRGGFAGQVLGLGLSGLGLGQAIPDATARVTLLAPAALEMAEALGYAPGSRVAAGLGMGVLVGFGLMVAPFLTSSSTALLMYALLPEATRADLSWGAWALRAAPLHVILFSGLMVGVLALYRPGVSQRPTDRSRVLAVQRALLGKPTRHEQLAGAIAVLVLIGSLTSGLHGVSPTWVSVAGFILLAATGVLTAQTLRAVNWSFLLVFGVFTSMAGVFSTVGVDHWLESVVAGSLGSLASAPTALVLALAVVCFVINLVLRLPVAAPLVMVALAPIAPSLGISPSVAAIVALTACNGFLLPHQSNTYLALYHETGGRLFNHAQARPLAVLYMGLILVGLCVCMPIWRAMGLV